MELTRGKQLKEKPWDYIGNAPSSADHRQVISGRVSGRPHGRWSKGVTGSVSESGRHGVKHGGALTQVLMQQGERPYGQKHARGRRTLRKRRTEKKIIEALPERPGVKGSIRIVTGSPRQTGVVEKFVKTNIGGIEDNSNSTDDGADSDENAPETTYNFGKWDTGFTVAPHRTNNDVMDTSNDEGDDCEDDNGDEDGENLEEDIGINDYDADGHVEGNRDEGSDSIISGDYSD